MPLIQDDAVVIGRLDYSETSQVLVLVAREHGKIRAIAKGVKRSTKTRFAAGIDLLDAGRVVVSSRTERAAGLATLTEWKQTRSFSGLRERLSRLHAGQYAAEILTHLTEDWDPHPPLFDVFVATLDLLAHADEPLPTVTRFQVALLTAIGSVPRFDTCLNCVDAERLTHFSSHQGGTLCRNCEAAQFEKREISARSLHALRSLTGLDRRSSAEKDTLYDLGAFDILDYHIAHLMGREPALSPLLVRSQDRRQAQASP